jgi:hypothetical protein
MLGLQARCHATVAASPLGVKERENHALAVSVGVAAEPGPQVPPALLSRDGLRHVGALRQLVRAWLCRPNRCALQLAHAC